MCLIVLDVVDVRYVDCFHEVGTEEWVFFESIVECPELFVGPDGEWATEDEILRKVREASSLETITHFG